MTIGVFSDSRRIRTLTMALALGVAGVSGTVGVLATRADSGASASNGLDPGPGGRFPAGPLAESSASPTASKQVVTGAVGSPGTAKPAHPAKPAKPPARGSDKPTAQQPPPLRAPAAPASLAATPGDGRATLCWTAPARADGYVIYQRDATAGEAWKRLPYPVPGPCWTGGMLINGHTYQYKIRAGNAAGESGFSNTVGVLPAGTKPGPPTGLTATPAGSAQAKLCWSAGPHATGYAVYVRDVTTNAAWTRLPYPVPGPCWTGGLLVNGDHYAFKLRSGNAYGESGYSNTAEVTPHA